MTIVSTCDVRAPDQILSDDGLLKIALAFVVICLFSFLVVLFPSSASADPLTPVSAMKMSDHRVPPPALTTSFKNTLAMSPSPKIATVNGRVQRTAGSAVILSYLLGVRTVHADTPSRRELALQRKAQHVVNTRPDTKSGKSEMALVALQNNWRWSR